MKNAPEGGPDVAAVDRPDSKDPGRDGDAAGVTRRELLAGAAAAATLLASGRARAASRPQRIFRIHPAINVARAGNAPADTSFIAPEVPGQGPVEVNGGRVTKFK